MKINDIDSLISYMKKNPKTILCSYDGDWIAYKLIGDDLSLLNDVTFNNDMMRCIEDLKILTFEKYVISHHSARLYSISNIKNFQSVINSIKTELEYLLDISKDKKFKSVKDLIGFLEENEYHTKIYKLYYPVSHFIGGKSIQSINIWRKGKKDFYFCFSFPYYMASNLINYGFYKRLNRLYTNIYTTERTQNDEIYRC